MYIDLINIFYYYPYRNLYYTAILFGSWKDQQTNNFKLFKKYFYGTKFFNFFVEYFGRTKKILIVCF